MTSWMHFTRLPLEHCHFFTFQSLPQLYVINQKVSGSKNHKYKKNLITASFFHILCNHIFLYFSSDGAHKNYRPSVIFRKVRQKGSLTVLALYAYFSDSQNAAFEHYGVVHVVSVYDKSHLAKYFQN